MLNRGSSSVFRFRFSVFGFRLVRAEKLATTFGFPGAHGINRLEQLQILADLSVSMLSW
jgi:hypothetical protein